MAKIRPSKTDPAEVAKTYQSAVKTHKPPVKLNATEKKVFDDLIESREYETWTTADLHIAAKAAQLIVEIDRQWIKLKGEDTVQDASNGTKANPRLAAYKTLMDQYHQQLKMLGLSASQRGLRGPKQARRNHQQINQKRKLASVSDLLAKPKAE